MFNIEPCVGVTLSRDPAWFRLLARSPFEAGYKVLYYLYEVGGNSGIV